METVSIYTASFLGIAVITFGFLNFFWASDLSIISSTSTSSSTFDFPLSILFIYPSISAPSSVFKVFLKKISPLITALFPTILELAVIFPSTCPLISTFSTFNVPLIYQVS